VGVKENISLMHTKQSMIAQGSMHYAAICHFYSEDLRRYSTGTTISTRDKGVEFPKVNRYTYRHLHMNKMLLCSKSTFGIIACISPGKIFYSENFTMN
jgi:hypothetical protein